MRIETFFENFELLAETPGAVGRLRELVLGLAVQGRLARQSAEDEPADVLAGRIAEDRAAFVKARGLSRQRVFEPVPDEQRPFALPSGWAWTRLGELCRVQAGFAFDSAAFVQGDSGVPMIRIRDITKDHTQVNYIGDYRDEFLVESGDYLVGMDGNFTIAKWRGPRALLNQRVSRLQWYSDHLEPLYFAIAAQYRLTELQGTKAYTTVDHLSSGQIENAIVPLPPLAEQRRIVAKVDELMALCDRLEAQERERETRHAALVRAAVGRFGAEPTVGNLDVLFHPSYAVTAADLRKTILTLAVQGKLLPQDSNDEPVEDSVRSARKKARLPVRALGELEASEVPFAIPGSWRSVTVADVAETRLGKMLDKEKNRGEAYLYLRNTNVHWFRFELESIKTMRFEYAELDEYRVEPGDVLICEGGHGIARSAVWHGQIPGIMFQKALHRVRPLSCLNGHFLAFCLWVYERDGILQRYYTGAGIPHFTGKSLARVSFPLPPLAEQRRIVAKVDQLMALVDQLEARIAEGREVGARLMEAVMAEMAAA